MWTSPFLRDLGEIFRQALWGSDGPGPVHGPSPRPPSDPGTLHGFSWGLLPGTRTHLEHFWGSYRIGIAAGLVLVFVVGLFLRWLRARAWQRARSSARWVEVVAPAATETRDGQAMWRQLTGLLRPGALGARMRLLSWELHAAHEQVHAGLWVPGSINPAHVARAVSGAYPRAAVSLGRPGDDLGPPLPLPRPAPAGLRQRVREWVAWQGGRVAPFRRPAAVGYLLVPRISMWLPLLADAPFGARSGPRASRSRSVSGGASDPLGMLCLGLAATPPGYRMIVQVLARPLPPATRSAARRVRRSGGAPAGPGLPGRGVLGILDLLEAGLRAVLDLASPTPTVTGERAGRRVAGEALDPVTRQQRRDAAGKSAAELVEICVRVMVCGPNRRRCRERAWESANNLRAVITAQGSDTIRLPHPDPTISTRTASNWRAAGLRLSSRAGHRRGWFVATDTEIGALARLPHHPALYRFDVARAPHLPAPAQIPRIRPVPFTRLNGVAVEQVSEPTSGDDALWPEQAPAGAGPAGFGSDDVDATDPDERDQDQDWADDDGSGWYGWDEDFPELGWYEDTDPEDGYGPDGDYPGGAT